jgi:hypothetical protein
MTHLIQEKSGETGNPAPLVLPFWSPPTWKDLVVEVQSNRRSVNVTIFALNHELECRLGFKATGLAVESVPPLAEVSSLRRAT